MKFYNKLSNAKTTIPTYEAMREKEIKDFKIKKRISGYHIF